MDLSELIKELEKRGQVIEPPATEAKTIKGNADREKVRQITKKYLLEKYFNEL